MKNNKVVLGLLIFIMFFTTMFAVNVDAAADKELFDTVEKQVYEYGNSIAIPQSDEEMLEDLLMYSWLHPGEHYVTGEGDYLTAALFNSNLLREILSHGIANSIRVMEQLGVDYLYCAGGPSWYSYGCSYSIGAYLEEAEKLQVADKIVTVASAKTNHGSSRFDAVLNGNDKALLLTVGSSKLRFSVEKSEVKEDKIIYDVNVKVSDDFNFNGTYDKATAQGYNTFLEKFLTAVGKNALNEYTWESKVSFQIEAPYDCDHTQGVYQWTLDPDSKLMSSASGENFIVNEATKRTYTTSSSEKIYYELDKPVKLYHDRPWVIEYSGKKIGTFHLGTQAKTAIKIPYFYHGNSTVTAFIQHEKLALTEEEEKELEKDPEAEVARSQNHYYGLSTSGVYKKYYSKYEIIHRLENVVNEDGTNMIYMTISYVNKNGKTKVLMDRKPLDGYSYKLNTEPRTEFESGCEWISGKDFIINYIGNKDSGLKANTFELTVWTNGKDGENVSSYEEKYITGNCQEPSRLADVCADCHHEIVKHSEPGTHIYGSYKNNNNATCTKDATKTATCKYCGVKKTVSIKGTALGHQPKKIRDCSATCVLSGFIGGEVCERCDAVLVENTIIPAKGHDLEEWVATKKPSCVKEGLERRDCKRCNYYEERVAGMTEHVWEDNYTVDKPATYEEEGLMTIRCADCNKENGSAIIPKLGSASCESIFSYTGKQSVPTLKIVDVDGKALVEGTDYKYVVRNIKNAIVREPKAVGDYVVHITYIGKYSGEDRLNYSIVPAAPKNVKVKLTAHDDVKVSWSKAEPAVGYMVYYKTAAAKTYKLYGTTTGTSVTIKNLSDSTTYNIKVVSYSSSNGKKVESKSSDVVKIKTLSNLASPKSVTLKLTAHDDIKVSWKKVTNAKGYYVYYKKDTAKTYASYKVTTKTSITLKDLADNTKYDIKIVPYGVSGSTKVKSDKYTEKSISTLKNLKAPQNLKLKAAGKTVLKATWSKSANAKGYYVYYKVTGTDTYKLYKTTTETSISIKGLKKNTKYTVKVVPYGVSSSVKVKSDNYSIKALKTLNK